jgi:hypothetical protein
VNPWDVATWLAAVVLATSALVIFIFFLRDARSILNREMHPDSEEEKNASPSDATPEPARSGTLEKHSE